MGEITLSVVAWDGKTLAADRQGSQGDLRFRTCKIRKLPNGDLVAFTGPLENGMAVALWYEKGADPAAWPASQKGDDWSRLIVVSRGKVFVYEQLPLRQPVLERVAAWGSGRDFALGAMAMGATAERAVQVASRFASSCGFGVQAFQVR